MMDASIRPGESQLVSTRNEADEGLVESNMKVDSTYLALFTLRLDGEDYADDIIVQLTS